MDIIKGFGHLDNYHILFPKKKHAFVGNSRMKYKNGEQGVLH